MTTDETFDQILDQVSERWENLGMPIYKLDGHKVVKGTFKDYMVEQMRMARGDEDAHRVAYTQRNGVTVSTIFDGFSYCRDGCFETMVFGGPYNEKQWYCATWEEAERQHRAIVLLAIGETQPEQEQ